MASSANSLLPPIHTHLPSSKFRPGFSTHFHQLHQPCPTLRPPRKLVLPVVSSLTPDPLLSEPASLFLISENVGYSTASYYTSLGLFVISVPGLWSLIKRSVKSKVCVAGLWKSVIFFSPDENLKYFLEFYLRPRRIYWSSSSVTEFECLIWNFADSEEDICRRRGR